VTDPLPCSTITTHPNGYALVSLHGKYGEGKFAKIDLENVELVSPYRWGINSNGYVRTVVGPVNQRRDILLHRLILGIQDLPFNQLHTDHKHHDKLDNRRSEIRKATPSQNGRNSRGCGRSGYKGVYKSARSPKWTPMISLERGVNHYLGRYDDKEDAARVYDGAARALFGEFAFTNFEALPTRRVGG
jgi:hypothetical protein